MLTVEEILAAPAETEYEGQNVSFIGNQVDGKISRPQHTIRSIDLISSEWIWRKSYAGVIEKFLLSRSRDATGNLNRSLFDPGKSFLGHLTNRQENRMKLGLLDPGPASSTRRKLPVIIQLKLCRLPTTFCLRMKHQSFLYYLMS